MAAVLKEKKIYRIDINNKFLKKYIEKINWGYYLSHTDNKPMTREYYRTVSKEDYFKEYNDNPPPGQPLFAPISHIGIQFKNGICPFKFLDKIEDDTVIESMMPDKYSHLYKYGVIR